MSKSAYNLGTISLPDPASFGLGETEEDLRAIDRQMRREATQVERGAAKFYLTLRDTAFGTTVPGIRLLRDIVAEFLPAVILAQEDARKGIEAADAGRPQAWWWLIGWLKPETLAYLTCRIVVDNLMNPRMGRHPNAEIFAVKLTSTAIEVGSAIKTELELEMWKREEAKLSKADKERTNMYKLMLLYSEVNPRTLNLWRKKIETIPKMQWQTKDKLHLGTKLIELLVKHGGNHFGVTHHRDGHKLTSYLYMSEETGRALVDTCVQIGLSRPFLGPMTCKPLPWVRTEL